MLVVLVSFTKLRRNGAGVRAHAVDGVDNKVPVYMGIGIDAPAHNNNQAKCTPKMVYQSVKNSVEAGAQGLIYSPNYSFMKLSNLDASVQALKDLEII